MKNLIPITLAATFVASGISSAQTPAYSKPSGYVTQNLNQGFNLVALTLQRSPVASGTFTSTNGVVLTDSSANFTGFIAGRIYTLEILSGSLANQVAEVSGSSIAGQTITTTQNLSALGIGNARYAVRLAPTLEEIFGVATVTSGGILKAALNSTSADNIWIPNGSGGYDRYFLRSGAYQKITGPTTREAAPNVPIVYLDGILIEKRDAGVVPLTVTGSVKTTATTTSVIQGFNLVSVVAPVGLTLRTSGLDDGDLKPALNPSSADNLWVQQTDGSYKRYYRRGSVSSPAAAVWRDVATNTEIPLAVDPSLTGAVLIERRDSTPASVSFTVPNSFNNL